MNNTLKLSSPWQLYAQKVSALFEADPDINVVPLLEAENKAILLRVANAAKSDALEKLLPAHLDFGGVELSVRVERVPDGSNSLADLFAAAFSGNPRFGCVSTGLNKPGLPSFVFVEMKASPVQFWADNLGDVRGAVTMLPQDLARDVFAGGAGEGAAFCTEELAPFSSPATPSPK